MASPAAAPLARLLPLLVAAAVALALALAVALREAGGANHGGGWLLRCTHVVVYMLKRDIAFALTRGGTAQQLFLYRHWPNWPPNAMSCSWTRGAAAQQRHSSGAAAAQRRRSSGTAAAQQRRSSGAAAAQQRRLGARGCESAEHREGARSQRCEQQPSVGMLDVFSFLTMLISDPSLSTLKNLMECSSSDMLDVFLF
jgi:hypothetical protein